MKKQNKKEGYLALNYLQKPDNGEQDENFAKKNSHPI